MNKKYIVRLTDEERAICEATIKEENGTSEKLRRATILLKADADGPDWDDAKISEAIGCRTRTVENVRQAFVCEGFESALVRKKPATSPTPKLLDGAAEAKLIALRLGSPPLASAIGLCDYWPIKWWNWRSWRRSARRRCVRR
jgi:Homeodomain-like domain